MLGDAQLCTYGKLQRMAFRQRSAVYSQSCITLITVIKLNNTNSMNEYRKAVYRCHNMRILSGIECCVNFHPSNLSASNRLHANARTRSSSNPELQRVTKVTATKPCYLTYLGLRLDFPFKEYSFVKHASVGLEANRNWQQLNPVHYSKDVYCKPAPPKKILCLSGNSSKIKLKGNG